MESNAETPMHVESRSIVFLLITSANLPRVICIRPNVGYVGFAVSTAVLQIYVTYEPFYTMFQLQIITIVLLSMTLLLNGTLMLNFAF